MADPVTTLDPETLATLRGGLRIVALRRLREADAADECVQEVLARTLELVRAGRVRSAQELTPIAYGIARHVIVDEIRRRVRAQRVSLFAGDAVSAAPDVLAPLIAGEERERLRAAWSELSDEDREILHITFFEGVEPSELARRRGQPPERVRKQKSRALERLRRAFFGGEAASTAEVSHAEAAPPMKETVGSAYTNIGEAG